MHKLMQLHDDVALVNDALERLLPPLSESSPVRAAMHYSCDGGGKRIRPVLLLECCRLCGGDVQAALPFACALEMIHTYSLIHDDLPCMDDDDLRRGKPSCHKQFGEAYALLAGDALLTHAFEVCATSAYAKAHSGNAVRAIAMLASFAGAFGMIGGQEIDLQSEEKEISLVTLRDMDARKTGALIRAACQIGAVLGGGTDAQVEALGVYADNIGQVFQIVDDILDVVGDEATLGKPIGSDAESGKSTYVSLLGLDRSKEIAAELTEKAIEALNPFGESAAFLRDLAVQLSTRTN